jgi:hypothetical protein
MLTKTTLARKLCAGCLVLAAYGALMSQNTPAKASEASDPEVSAFRVKYEAALASHQEAANKEKATLVAQYTAFLTKLETKLQAAGNLDRVLVAREEREKVLADGSVTTHKDPELDRSRESYLSRSDEIRRRTGEKEKELQTAYLTRLQAMETEFTKAGKIPAAIAARQERERIVTSAAAAAPASGTAAVSAGAGGSSGIPDVSPPLTGEENPFKAPVITKSFTVAPGKYRLRERIELKKPDKGEQGPTVLFPPGSDVGGAADGFLFIAGGSQIIGRDSRFADLPVRGDLGGKGFFSGCSIRNCTFGKGGGWFGGIHASRWHFEKCTVERTFMPKINVGHEGLRLLQCKVDGVDLPSIIFEKQEVSQTALTDWLQVRQTRFEKCKIPLSFLLITDSCSFVQCTFVDDENPPTLDKPLTVTIYEKDSTWRTKSPLINMTVEKRPLEDLKIP